MREFTEAVDVMIAYLRESVASTSCVEEKVAGPAKAKVEDLDGPINESVP